MDQWEMKEAKELNKLLGQKLSEAYKEIARLRANNTHQDQCNAAVVADLQKNLESAEEKSERFQNKITVLQRKLADKKRQKTQLRIELNRMRARMERVSKISSTPTVLNPDWSTDENLKNSISNQANITPQTVFKVST